MGKDTLILECFVVDSDFEFRVYFKPGWVRQSFQKASERSFLPSNAKQEVWLEKELHGRFFEHKFFFLDFWI